MYDTTPLKLSLFCHFQLRKFEAELRTRESREGTEVLMSALQAMQDKNSTLEKNLSAETRVKLDLFSALGEAKRQLEIRESAYATHQPTNRFIFHFHFTFSMIFQT